MLSIEFLRQFRIGEYAVFDFAASFIGIALLSPLLSKLFLKINISIPKKNWIFLTLPIGIITHLLFGSLTPMTKDFLDLQGHYLLKVLIIALILLGLRRIKRIKQT